MESTRISELVALLTKTTEYWAASVHAEATKDESLYEFNLGIACNHLDELSEACDRWHLPMSRLEAQRVKREMRALPWARERKHVRDNIVPRLLRGLLDRIQDETSLRVYFHLPDESRKLYEDTKPFGERVWEVFPDAIPHAEEAAKCLALERGTACVFHCISVLDLGVRALIGSFEGGTEFLQTHERLVWREFVRRIRQESNKGDAGISPAWKGRASRLQQLAESLSLIADASRNPTMHAVRCYSLEEARDVFRTTGAFMRRLAEDLADIAGTGVVRGEASSRSRDEGWAGPEPEVRREDVGPVED